MLHYDLRVLPVKKRRREIGNRSDRPGTPYGRRDPVNGDATLRNISLTIVGFPWGNIVESGGAAPGETEQPQGQPSGRKGTATLSTATVPSPTPTTAEELRAATARVGV